MHQAKDTVSARAYTFCFPAHFTKLIELSENNNVCGHFVVYMYDLLSLREIIALCIIKHNNRYPHTRLLDIRVLG